MSGARGPLSEGTPEEREARQLRPSGDASFPVERPTIPNIITGEAKREWKRIADVLAKQGRLALSDRAALTRYCIAWADLRELARMLDDAAAEHGPLVKYLDIGTKGQSVQGALIKTRRDMARDLADAERDLGLTVSTRLRLPAPEVKPESPVDELKRRREERRAKRAAE